MKKIIFLYQYCIALPILIALTIITALVTLVFSPIFGHLWWGYYPPHFWAKCWCWLLLIKVDVRNREYVNTKTSYVFVANHQGAFDIFSIYGYLGHNFKWMMKKSLEKIPFVGVACLAAGHIMVDHSTPQAVAKTMEDARKRLTDGMSLVIFPEGSRSNDGSLHPFKRGAFKLATDFQLPVVPITIDGSYKILRKGSYMIHPGKIVITIHKPIESGNTMEYVMSKSYDDIKSALKQ